MIRPLVTAPRLHHQRGANDQHRGPLAQAGPQHKHSGAAQRAGRDRGSVGSGCVGAVGSGSVGSACSVGYVGSVGSACSVGAVGSVGSACSVGSVGAVGSVGSVGSACSVGAVGSGSVGLACSVGSVGSACSVGSAAYWLKSLLHVAPEGAWRVRLIQRHRRGYLEAVHETLSQLLLICSAGNYRASVGVCSPPAGGPGARPSEPISFLINSVFVLNGGRSAARVSGAGPAG